jgi:hypothetical protein
VQTEHAEHVRVSSGEFDTEKLVATPAQALRAAMRLYELGLGMRGAEICTPLKGSGGDGLQGGWGRR